MENEREKEIKTEGISYNDPVSAHSYRNSENSYNDPENLSIRTHSLIIRPTHAHGNIERSSYIEPERTAFTQNDDKRSIFFLQPFQRQTYLYSTLPY